MINDIGILDTPGLAGLQHAGANAVIVVDLSVPGERQPARPANTSLKTGRAEKTLGQPA